MDMKYNQYYNNDTMNLKQLAKDLESKAIPVNYQMMTIYVYTTSVT